MQYEYIATEIMVPQEIRIPTAGLCTGECGVYVVPKGRWDEIKIDVRRQLRGKFKMERSRGACTKCYERMRIAGDHVDLPTKQVSDEIFAEEYNLMRKQGMTDHNIRISLGMSEAAFEKAQDRGRASGRVTEAKSNTSSTGRILPATVGGKGTRSYSKLRRMTRGVNQ